MSDISVRVLTYPDRSAWEALWLEYNAFYGRAGESALSSDIVETAWRRMLDANEPVHGLVAERDGSLVGLVHYIFHRNMIRIAPTCYIQDLFTDPEARGLGVARLLIAKVADACRAEGSGDIYWHTHSSNTAARRLYDQIASDTEFTVYRMAVD